MPEPPGAAVGFQQVTYDLGKITRKEYTCRIIKYFIFQRSNQGQKIRLKKGNRP